MEELINKRVRIISKQNPEFEGVKGTIVEKVDNMYYKIKLDQEMDGCLYYVAQREDFEIIEEHHVVAPFDKVKELILENHKGYMKLRLKDKITIVKYFAHFDNDSELLEFLEYMEENVENV